MSDTYIVTITEHPESLLLHWSWHVSGPRTKSRGSWDIPRGVAAGWAISESRARRKAYRAIGREDRKQKATAAKIVEEVHV